MKYVICEGPVEAGLGDLIFAVITAIAYAKLTDRRLCIDWRCGIYGMPPEENLFDKIFKLNDVDYYPGLPQSDSVNPPIWRNSFNKSFEQLRRENGFPEFNRKLAIEQYSVDYTKFDHEEEVVVIWDFDLFDHLIDPLTERGIIEKPKSELHAMGQIYNKYIQLQEEPSRFIKSRLNKIFNKAGNCKILGVHIRETDESFNCYKPTKRKDYFYNTNTLLKKDKRIQKIFLATDNIKVQEQFISKYGKKVLVNEKWFEKPGNPLHLSLDLCPDKWENILNALLEIYALARCDYLIRRRETSFSRLSECIGLIENKNVEIIEKERTMREKASRWKHKVVQLIVPR